MGKKRLPLLPSLPSHSPCDMGSNVAFYFRNAATMTVISLPLILETQASTCKHIKVFKDREKKKKKHSMLSLNTKKETEETQVQHRIK